jgi:hypothetical protein
VKGGDSMLEHRLNSCLLLAVGKCPYQMQMARAYLIPQLMITAQLTFCQQTCMNCSLFEQIQRPLYLPALAARGSPMQGPSCC